LAQQLGDCLSWEFSAQKNFWFAYLMRVQSYERASAISFEVVASRI
jgi:hypothetical protein